MSPFPPCPVSSVLSFECTGPHCWKLWRGQTLPGLVTVLSPHPAMRWLQRGMIPCRQQHYLSLKMCMFLLLQLERKQQKLLGDLALQPAKDASLRTTAQILQPNWAGGPLSKRLWLDSPLRASVALPIYRDQKVETLWFFMQLKMTACGVT